MYIFSVMWHPTGDTSTVIGLTESHIVLWDLDTATSRVQVIFYSTTDPILTHTSNAKCFRNVTLINMQGLAEIIVPLRSYGRHSPNQVMVKRE